MLNLQFNLLDIQQENDLLEKSRKDYEELRNSLNITIYSTDNLYFDEFEILSLKPDILIDVNSSQKDLKLKFNDKLKDLFDQYFSNESPGNYYFKVNNFKDYQNNH